MIKLNQYQKSDKALLAIYTYLECLKEKTDGYKINSGSSSTINFCEQFPSGFSMYAISSFRNIENKHDVYRGKDCMKKIL